jgi:mannose-6-phosphate isomerase-like protein (cupin superfamily)
VVQGEYVWHKHDDEDEFFYVIEGRLLVDVEGDRTFELAARQGVSVPAGVMHRTRATERTVILMIEGAGVIPTGGSSDACEPAYGVRSTARVSLR